MKKISKEDSESSALGFAEKLMEIMTDRYASYGAPDEFHTALAAELGNMISQQFDVDLSIDKEFISEFMMSYKLLRFKLTGNRDDLFDIAGYAAISYDYSEKKAKDD